MYDPAIGRFSTMDPLAEKYYSVSPYVYCLNNPTRFIDPDGMEPLDWLSDLVKSAQQFLFGNAQTPPRELQGVDQAKYQISELEKGAKRAESATGYINALNEGIATGDPSSWNC